MSTYPDLLLTQLALMDDCLQKDGKSREVQLRLQQLQQAFRTWGLVAKCSLYTSPKHDGDSSISISGVTIKAQPTLQVMGVKFHAGLNGKDVLRGTWQQARGKFWSMRHLLRAGTPIGGWLKLLDRTVGNCALWNSCAFYPEYTAMEAVNQMMYQFVIYMLRLGKRSSETWDEYRRRSVRLAQALVHTHLTS